MPYRREAEIVLAMWRDVERELAEVPAGSPEAERLQADIARLRDEYQRLFDLAREHHPDEPFPEPAEAQ
jgi:hypothetical protein